MAIAAVPAGTGGGLSTVQDLYDIINGKTTVSSGESVTTSGATQVNSGGTTTQTDTSTMSQEAMSSMLQSILSGTQGLAAVSSGQRAAGGYGSSVNTMLTNDLLTRSAAQVAEKNSTKTQTLTASPTTISKTPTTVTNGGKTTTVGGITAGGVSKSAMTLGVLQGLSKLGGGDAIKKLKDTFGIGSGQDTGTIGGNVSENPYSANATNGSDVQSDQYVAQASSSENIAAPSAAGGTSFNIVDNMLADPSFDTSGSFDIAGYTSDFNFGETGGPIASGDFNMTDGQDYGAWSGGDVSSVVDAGSDFNMTGANIDDWTFADGGLVGAKKPVARFADGGEVSSDPVTAAKKAGILGTSQYSKVTEIRDAGTGTGANAAIEAVSATPANQAAMTALTRQTATQAPLQASQIVEASQGGGDGTTQSNANETASPESLGRIGNALGTVGMNMGMSVANGLTGGLAGQVSKGVGVAKGIASMDVASLTDIGIGIAAPGLAAVNSVLGMLGLATIGQIGVNAFGEVGVNDMVGPDQQASINAAAMNADADEAAAGLAEAAMLGDLTADATAMSAASTSAATGGGSDTNTDASSADAINGSDAMSDSFGGVVGGFGGDTSNSGNGDTGSDAGTGGGVGGSGNSAGDSSNAGMAADGGHIEGAGTGISDSIHAKLSDGEFVLSADVVKAIGVDKLNALQDKYHVPAAVQRLKQFGKR